MSEYEDDEEEVEERKGEEQAGHGDVIWAREQRGSYLPAGPARPCVTAWCWPPWPPSTGPGPSGLNQS